MKAAGAPERATPIEREARIHKAAYEPILRDGTKELFGAGTVAALFEQAQIYRQNGMNDYAKLAEERARMTENDLAEDASTEAAHGEGSTPQRVTVFQTILQGVADGLAQHNVNNAATKPK